MEGNVLPYFCRWRCQGGPRVAPWRVEWCRPRWLSNGSGESRTTRGGSRRSAANEECAVHDARTGGPGCPRVGPLTGPAVEAGEWPITHRVATVRACSLTASLPRRTTVKQPPAAAHDGRGVLHLVGHLLLEVGSRASGREEGYRAELVLERGGKLQEKSGICQPVWIGRGKGVGVEVGHTGGCRDVHASWVRTSAQRTKTRGA